MNARQRSARYRSVPPKSSLPASLQTKQHQGHYPIAQVYAFQSFGYPRRERLVGQPTDLTGAFGRMVLDGGFFHRLGRGTRFGWTGRGGAFGDWWVFAGILLAAWVEVSHYAEGDHREGSQNHHGPGIDSEA